MELIVITHPEFLPGEAAALDMLFAEGLQRLHLRKPGADESALRGLLGAISPLYRSRIVLHDRFALAAEFRLGGVHQNSRNTEIPVECASLPASRSCHTLEEVSSEAPKHAYVLLSPVFDSISKAGYESAFTIDELAKARENGIISYKVYALGGVDQSNIAEVARFGFGGVAVLGALWQEFAENRDVAALRTRFRQLTDAAEQAQTADVCQTVRT